MVGSRGPARLPGRIIQTEHMPSHPPPAKRDASGAGSTPVPKQATTLSFSLSLSLSLHHSDRRTDFSPASSSLQCQALTCDLSSLLRELPPASPVAGSLSAFEKCRAFQLRRGGTSKSTTEEPSKVDKLTSISRLDDFYRISC